MLLLDVGATNTRITWPGAEVHKRAVASPEALFDFVRSFQGAAPRETLVAGLAAAVQSDRRHAFVTNWQAELRVDDFHALGFLRVLFLNDLEASAWGLATDALDVAGMPPMESLSGGALRSHGHRVLIAPGTGLGSAGLVDLGAGAEPRWRPVPSELQHMEVPATPNLSADTLARVGARLGHAPTWEDFVSGRGVLLLDELAGGGARCAAQVALAALERDASASAAMDMYYELVGRFARVLASAYMALGGVLIAGASTAANADLMRRSPLLRAFREPSVLTAGGMGDVPLVLVLGELNLIGARAAAEVDPQAAGLDWSVRG